MFQQLNILLVLMGPKLNTALVLLCHHDQVQRKSHLPVAADHIISDAVHDAFGLLGYRDTLLGHIQQIAD